MPSHLSMMTVLAHAGALLAAAAGLITTIPPDPGSTTYWGWDQTTQEYVAFSLDGAEIERLPGTQSMRPSGARVDATSAVVEVLAGAPPDPAGLVVIGPGGVSPVTVGGSVDPSATPAADLGLADLAAAFHQFVLLSAGPTMTLITSMGDDRQIVAASGAPSPLFFTALFALEHGGTAATYLGRAVADTFPTDDDALRFVRVDDDPAGGMRFVLADYDPAEGVTHLDSMPAEATAVAPIGDTGAFLVETAYGSTAGAAVWDEHGRRALDLSPFSAPQAAVVDDHVVVWDHACEAACKVAVIGTDTGRIEHRWEVDGPVDSVVCWAPPLDGWPSHVLTVADEQYRRTDATSSDELGLAQPMISSMIRREVSGDCRYVLSYDQPTSSDPLAASGGAMLSDLRANETVLDDTAGHLGPLLASDPDRGIVVGRGDLGQTVITSGGARIEVPHIGDGWRWVDDRTLVGTQHQPGPLGPVGIYRLDLDDPARPVLLVEGAAWIDLGG